MTERRSARSAGRARVGEEVADVGSASVWVLAAALAVLTVGVAAMAVAAAISTRHRAESAADLAALAGAAAVRDGGDGCRAAARIATANRASVARCLVGADLSITVVVAVPLPQALRRWSASADVRAVARAGS
jgi:secretion/DNA translocation related TadE-like protein